MRLLPVLLLLSGCAASIPEKPIVNTITVKVPVQVPCRVSLPAVPIWELSRTSPDVGLFEAVRAAVIELRQRQAYQAELLAAARACE